MRWDCLGQKRQHHEIVKGNAEISDLDSTMEARGGVLLQTARRMQYLGGELVAMGRRWKLCGTHWHWWNHLSTRSTILNPCLVENQVCFPSTFPHATQHSKAHKKGGGSRVNSTAMTSVAPHLQASRPGVPPLKGNKVSFTSTRKSSNQFQAGYQRQWLTQASLPQQEARKSPRISATVTPIL